MILRPSVSLSVQIINQQKINWTICLMILALYGSLRSVSMFSVWPFKTPNLTVPRGGLLFVPEAQLKPRGFLSEAWSYGRSCLKKSGQQKNGDLLKILFFKHIPPPPRRVFLDVTWVSFSFFFSHWPSEVSLFILTACFTWVFIKCLSMHN